MNIALVYQAGIANVFLVRQYGTKPEGRKAVRLLQHAFSPCEYFARGMQEAGASLRVYSCNKAGDIAELEWTEGLDDCPFRDQANPLPMTERKMTEQTTHTPKLKMVCAKCGSEDVLADAYAQWNVEKQDWQIADVFDKGHYCNACECECRIDEEPIE